MGALELPLLALAAFLAGAVNALAGGGSLLSFPALIAAGLTPLAANVTNTVALWPGYAGSVLGFRPELDGQAARLRGFVVDAVVGAAAGSFLLLALPAEAFDLVVPTLVLLATALLALQPRLARRLRDPGPGPARGQHRARSTPPWWPPPPTAPTSAAGWAWCCSRCSACSWPTP